MAFLLFFCQNSSFLFPSHLFFLVLWVFFVFFSVCGASFFFLGKRTITPPFFSHLAFCHLSPHDFLGALFSFSLALPSSVPPPFPRIETGIFLSPLNNKAAFQCSRRTHFFLIPFFFASGSLAACTRHWAFPFFPGISQARCSPLFLGSSNSNAAPFFPSHPPSPRAPVPSQHTSKTLLFIPSIVEFQILFLAVVSC